ncbi:tRNA lysidine(34) synthetase TilS [Prevotella sp. HUN102]|uniref:tRNA lysidine(34) synthetase TilS n=1 Tax=Prevotella sp. HUN102 TaxID=1392486 RepID=UPI00048C7166|nr:tRNA lysidine(34) synthetase TilS [Prevotella sp. HUN102]
MLNKVKAYIDKEKLLNKQKLYLVGLSGGTDSVSLLLILQQLGYRIEAAHCNFNLRGEESIRDEQFCIDLCSKLNIKLHIIHFDTMSYAELHKVSIEMAARELRYKYFTDLSRDIDAEGVCIAHHRDDSVETVFLNLVRGTGLKGLQGIRPKNGNIIRPLLNCQRSELEDYLTGQGESYITDSSNLKDDVKRNKLRINILPQLREINPSIDKTIARMSQNIIEAGRIINASISGILPSLLQGQAEQVAFFTHILYNVEQNASPEQRPKLAIFDKEVIKAFPSSEYLLFFLLQPFRFNSVQIQEVNASLDVHSGKSWTSDGYELVLDRDALILSATDGMQKGKTMKFPETGKYVFSDALTISIEEKTIDKSFIIPKSRQQIAVDADNINFPITCRTVTTGDRFIPFGMNGSKLVSDYLTDIKLNLIDKRSQLVLVDASERIVWVLGLRSDNRFKITPETKRAILISLQA